jgi:hypothetical protein
MANVNATQFSHFGRRATSDLPWGGIKPRSTRTLHVTHTRQGLAGGHWTNAIKNEGLGHAKRGKKKNGGH